MSGRYDKRIFVLTLIGLATLSTASRESAFIGYSELKGKKVVLTTSFGQINIHLRPNLAPETVAAVHHLAAKATACTSCKLYRSEEPPPVGSSGPPYGLLQGSLGDLAEVPPHEGGTIAKRGHVCMIPRTKEFFISLKDHDDWGVAHTVWGEVDAEDMRGTVATFLRLPVHEVKHPEFGTIMRMLDSEEPFSISLASDAAEA
ncbi:g8454 [Coccomyxa elongata]